MKQDDSGPAFGQCWGVWFRSGLVPDGEWHVWQYTLAPTRDESLSRVKGSWGHDPGWWRKYRRRGIVKCVRTTLSDSSPLEIVQHAQGAEDV